MAKVCWDSLFLAHSANFIILTFVPVIVIKYFWRGCLAPITCCAGGNCFPSHARLWSIQLGYWRVESSKKRAARKASFVRVAGDCDGRSPYRTCRHDCRSDVSVTNGVPLKPSVLPALHTHSQNTTDTPPWRCSSWNVEFAGHRRDRRSL